MQSYKLFCSFTGLYHLLDSGRVSFDDLRQETSLFFFGCSWEHIHAPLPTLIEAQNISSDAVFACSEWIAWRKDNLERNLKWAAEFRAILLAAEKDGRVSWRDPKELYRYKEAKMFLSRFGLWLPEYDRAQNGIWNNYLGIEEILEGKVQVLWR